jgi:hypothetical protein
MEEPVFRGSKATALTLGVSIVLVLRFAVLAGGVTASDGGLSIAVEAATAPVPSLAASESPLTLTCSPGSVLVGGGVRAFTTRTFDPQDPYHPINGLVLRGTLPSDVDGTPSPDGAGDPRSWTAFGGFAGQSETGDVMTGFALCASGGPEHTVVVSRTVNGPASAQTTATAVATCPPGSRLIGGGARVVPAAQPSVKPVGSYPSDAAGDRAATSDPDSWTAVGEAGGLQMGSGSVATTAVAVCSNDDTPHTTVARTAVIDHPGGPGNGNPGSDPIATVTATCPDGTTLLDGGALAIGNASGDDGGNLQQGVHLRGSYPSDSSANAADNGASNPSSWSAIVQSGGQNTPGTDSFAYALCALPAPTPPSPETRVEPPGPPPPAPRPAIPDFTPPSTPRVPPPPH